MNRSKLKLKKKKKNNQVNVLKPIITRFFNQILITTILLLITLIIIKQDTDMKKIIYENVYQKNLSFASTSELYQKYLGSILPLGTIDKKEISVFQEKLIYEKDEKYNDGVRLTVEKNYMVPLLESGIVVFMGEKEGYGNTVIIQQVNGIDVWYGNIEVIDLKMYDYVEKGELLGETKTEQLYLVFQKEGEFLNYKEYI